MLCLSVVALRASDRAHAAGAQVGTAAGASSAPAGRAQIAEGGEVYRKWCVECHNARGFGTVTLERRLQGAGPAILDQRRDLEPEAVRYVVRNGISFMPIFRKTEITDQQLDAITAYLASDPSQREIRK